MKAIKRFFGCFIFFIYFPCFCLHKPYCVITNDITGSPYARMGDQMVRYCKAKWLAYKYNIKLFLTSFPNSDKFVFSQCEKILSDADKKEFKKVVFIKNENDLASYLKKLKVDTLFKVGLHTVIKDGGLSDYLSFGPLYSVSRKNQSFESELRRLLQPLVAVPQINLPERIITVAVHIRKGGGFDNPLSAEQYFDGSELFENYEFTYVENEGQEKEITRDVYSADGKNQKQTMFRPSDRIWPMRFPSEQYYVDQIKKLSELLYDVPLYVYIFTDDPKPQEILERFKKTINKQNIVFATRSGENIYGDHVIEDMFAMAHFDCLIRSVSDFAFIPQLIGSHKIIFFPLHKRWISEKKLFIDKVGVFLNKPQSNDPKAKFFDVLFADHHGYLHKNGCLENSHEM
jgi:hypothetical protein